MTSHETTEYEIYDADGTMEVTHSYEEALAAFQKNYMVVEWQIWNVKLSHDDNVITTIIKVWK